MMENLEAAIKTNVFGKKIYYKEEIDSTNTEGKRLAENMGSQGLDFHGSLVVAEKQTLGKGRRGKSWSSPKGSGIWMSLVLKPKIELEKASMLTLVAAVSVAKAIKSYVGLEAWIKWPNDIVVNGKKVCGILTEMSSQSKEIRYVVVGIGINVNIETFPEEIRETATSLWLESGREEKFSWISREGLIAEVMSQMETAYGSFLQAGNLGPLMESYNRRLANCGRQVKVYEEKGILQGRALGINEKGQLLVETEDGMKEIYSGEVSVRGLYGYV